MNPLRIDTARALGALLTLCSSIVASSGVAKAASADEQTQAFITLFTEVSKTEAFVLGCADKLPQYKAANTEAFKAWITRNSLESLGVVMRAFSSKSPEMTNKLAQVMQGYVALVEKQPLAKLEPICKNLPQTLKQANSNTVKTQYAAELQALGELAQSLSKSRSSTTSSTASSTEQADLQKKREKAAQEMARTFRTTPNGGVKPAQIETLGETNEEVDAGNNMHNYEYRVHLFLKDGTVYRALEVPPSDFDAASSRKKDPKNWTQWKRSGKDMLLRYGNTWKKFEGELHTPAGKSTLEGYLESTTFSGSSALGSSSYSKTALTFKPGGKFETSDDSLSATGSAGLLPGNGSTRSSYSNKDGRISTSSSGTDDGFTTVNAAGSSTQKNNADRFSGTYRIDGYTLELKYGDGTVSRDLFFPLSSDTFYKSNNWWELKK